MVGGAGRATVRSLGEVSEDVKQMVEDVRAGLLGVPKDLSPWPKYFYDEKGSELFEEITVLPEYYQTRTELLILRDKAPEILARTGCRELVELGSGSSSKTRILLDAMLDAGEGLVRYVPFDVSESALRESGERLLEEYPGLRISGCIGDFKRSLGGFLGELAGTDTGERHGGRLVILLGGTIGNFPPERRCSFLSELRAGLDPGDHLLIGADLVKDLRILKAAYNDGAGVTARFNKNLLKVINERLGGEFDPNLFVHRASYDATEDRVEMWLCSTVDQEVRIPDLDLEARFEAGEGMRTEISTKFTPESVRRMFDEVGIALLNIHRDDENLFGLALGKAEA